MRTVTKSRDAALSAAHAPIETVANSTDKGVEYAADNKNVELQPECPISYLVGLFEWQVGDGENPTSRSGYRESCLFNRPDPFESRRDSIIYAAGLASLLENEHKLGGLVFDSPGVAKNKGYRNYNGYRIEVFMVDHIHKVELLIYDRAGEPSEHTLECLDEEYFHLASLGYEPKRFSVGSDGSAFYRYIESRNGFVEFGEPESIEQPEQAIV